MVHNNKVLTVSYGTFSCTLEGFEDSFGTMKAIAEYFRDLAADDRYFGAEPPQPDAEMLARIAEREIARQVEARTDTGGIVLKAAEIEDARPEQVEAPDTAPPMPPAPPAQEDAEEPAAREPAQEFAPAPQAVAEPQAMAEPEPAEEPAPEAEPVAEEPASAQPAAAPAEPPAVHAEVEVLRAEVSVSEPVEPETEGPAPEAPAADSIAAKLQRIRAVVSQNDQASTQEEYTEDDFEAYAHPSTETLLKATIATATAGEAETEEDAGAAQAPAEPEQTDEPVSVAEAAAEPAEEAGEEEPGPEAFEATEEPEPAEIATFMADEDESAPEEDELINILGQDDHEYDEADPASARLVKVSRSELEAAVAAGELEEVTDEDAEPAEAHAPDAGADAAAPSSLSADDEAELQQELAQVEAEMAAGTSAEDSGNEDKRDAPFILSQSMQDEEADVSRLMAEAEEKMDDPEGSSRRQTYDHLRAAVAAKQADEAEAAGQPRALEDDPYRSDLSDVVRPRRPAAGEVRDRRPDTGARPAPLKLVAEQRVDQGVPQVNRGSVRPRRVTTVPLEDAIPPGADSTQGSFAEFAEQMGAVELPDLLEAAAAYLSFVEGREKFSRPQLMNKVRQLKQDEFNREDGLRSFGQLLRDGKIEKTGGGRFTATGVLGFRPDGDNDGAREVG